MPSIDPRQMEKMMRQMGINTKNITAKQVIIETDEGRFIIKNPLVTEVTMGGQKSFQVTGDVTKEQVLSQEDVNIVIEQTGVSKEIAEDALKKTDGNIAEAILLLKKE